MNCVYLLIGFIFVWCSADDKLTRYRNSPHAEELLYRYARYLENPDDAKAAEELAYMLAYVEYDRDAIGIYSSLVQRNPLHADAWCNMAFMLVRAGYIAEAIELYNRSLVCKENARTRLNLAIAQLTHGDLAHGFSNYEYRWEAFDEQHETFDRQWKGEDLYGKTICVHAEQGFGDTFMFVRYLRELKKMGAHVIFVAQEAAQAILRYCPYIDTVLAFDEPLPPFDYFCALLSVPSMLKTTLDTIPSEMPYLFADSFLVEVWKQRLADDRSFKVGICWQGKADYKESCTKTFLDARSCTLDYFKPLSQVQGVQLYSLQRMYGLDQYELCDAASWLVIFDESFDRDHGRFMDTAALIKNLDLVITIDTSIAHLAAGLGVPTWIVLPEPSDWRWLRNRTDTPWYPQVRLFRQSVPGNWLTVLETVAYELEKHVSYHSLFKQLYC